MPYTLPADTGRNFSTGADQIFIYVADQVPQFYPLVLTAFFLIIFLNGYFMQKKSEGRGDAPQWASIAGYSTSILAFIFYLIVGLINLTTVIVTIAISLLATIWFFTSKDSR